VNETCAFVILNTVNCH